MNWKWALGLVAFGLFLFLSDATLKAYIHYNVSPIHASAPVFPYGGIGVFQDWHGIDFSIVHVINKGAAWGAFASMQEWLLYARIFIIGALLSYLLFVRATVYRKVSLTFIAAGALGNIVDYFVYGHVVDMFYFIFWGYSYPVFNIADSAIFVGIMLLLIESLSSKIRGKSQPRKAI